MQEAMLKDRDLVNKSQDAFVSFLRYYKEHQLTFIFSQTLLDIGQAANSFHLFKIPRVKEILGKPIKSFVGRADVDLDKIEYMDSNKGKQKEDLLEKRKEKFERKKQIQQEREAEKNNEKVQK